MDVPGLWPGTEAPLLLFSHCVRLFLTLWTIAQQAALSMGFPRQEYWSGLPFPSPGDLPNPEVEPASSAWAGKFFTTELLGEPCCLPKANVNVM